MRFPRPKEFEMAPTPLRYGIVAALATAAAVVVPATPALAAPSTTVTPAGHAFSASLVAGTTADFVVGSTTVACDTSSTAGAVPAEPGNATADGAVTSVIAPPSFSNAGGACPTNIVFTTATTTTNNDAGDWTIALQYDPAGSTGTLTIPTGGVVTTTAGLAACTIVVAPDAPASVSGPWVPGTDTSLPVLDLSAGVEVPIAVSGGFGCPTAATAATFSASYEIADTTDPAVQITVGP
ncbi:hypothetical protein WEI85_33705 [Actinomycetes bacterium KLBMP 9797]